MKLYSCAYCPYSHRVRFAACEKEIEIDIHDVDLANKPPEIAMINRYGQVPILVDKNVSLYESNIINEYLDERFPHPHLFSRDIVQRSHARLLMHTIDKDIAPSVDILVHQHRHNDQDVRQARSTLRTTLMNFPGYLQKNKYLQGDEFSILDITIAPLLWRLKVFGVRLPASATPLHKYAERIFSRRSFIHSLTILEKAMRV